MAGPSLESYGLRARECLTNRSDGNAKGGPYTSRQACIVNCCPKRSSEEDTQPNAQGYVNRRLSHASVFHAEEHRNR